MLFRSQARASIALELLHRAGDDELIDTVLRVAQFTGLRVVASGDVLMHLRSSSRCKTPSPPRA